MLKAGGCAAETLAHLIKAFLRRLPGGGLLGAIPRAMLEGCSTAAACRELLTALPLPERHLFAWLVRVVLEVSARRDANKMGLRNLTLVLAPNLVVPAQRTSSAGKRGSGRNVPPPPSLSPLDELVAIENASNALHAFCAAAAPAQAAQQPPPAPTGPPPGAQHLLFTL